LLGDIRRISRELAAEDLLVCVAIARFAEIHFIRVAIIFCLIRNAVTVLEQYDLRGIGSVGKGGVLRVV
jgi:hypothetical protein